ncbi:MAG: N-6 DNA methylase [Candidatus Lokiarchaeota archaeon]|nr:N-6 DNA methylase [Candidatus Lokiarchaeota archaeon]
MASRAERSPARFTRWYIEAFQGITGALASDGKVSPSTMALAAGILNATIFLQFIRSARQKSALDACMDSRNDASAMTSAVAMAWLDAFVVARDRRDFDPGIWTWITRESTRFHFSIDAEQDGPNDDTKETIVPWMLDEACEALSRSIAGEEKIASRGAYYTPRAEISFMCKLATTRYLEGHLQGIPRARLEAIVFDHVSSMEVGDGGGAQSDLDHGMAGQEAGLVLATLSAMRVLDPACGSGAFLVGMADTLREVITRLAALHGKITPDPAMLTRSIVSALHGVDSDALAIQVARLRVYLWFIKHGGVPRAPTSINDLFAVRDSIVEADFFSGSWLSAIDAFDIVIGNPPYVRQEDIKPGPCTCAMPGRGEKSRYKDALVRELKSGRPRLARISRACDLYVYFFVKAVQVLRDGGELCFITSNTWLDARFGQDLHGFLLENTSDLSIFDFDKRSFHIADINTVITACTRRRENDSASDTASFIHFKIHPGQVRSIPRASREITTREPCVDGSHELHSSLLPSIQVVNASDARVIVVDTCKLRNENLPRGSGATGKWRVQYLNEHDIFYTIIQKSAGKLVPLGSIASVRAGCYSGINEFFYVNRVIIEKHGIEPAYIRPLLRSGQDVRTLAMRIPDDDFVIVVPPITKAELVARGHAGIVSYITWGESQVTKRGQKTAIGIPWPHVESVKRRACWYSLSEGNVQPARLFMQYIAHDRFYCPWSSEPVISDRCFHRVDPIERMPVDALAAVLNSSLQACTAMITGRTGLGGGALKLEAIDAKSMLVLDPRVLEPGALRELMQAARQLGNRMPGPLFEECGLDPSRPLGNQVPSPLPDRAALDKVIFDALELSDEERIQVYRAACLSVEARLKKARSCR